MASNSKKTTSRRRWRLTKAGRKRKNQESKHSTPSYDELFAACGEPGKPLRKVVAKATPPAIPKPKAKPPAIPPVRAQPQPKS